MKALKCLKLLISFFNTKTFVDTLLNPFLWNFLEFLPKGIQSQTNINSLKMKFKTFCTCSLEKGLKC